MSERLILQDLVDLLSEKKGITKKDAEGFLRELIALISENIESNEPVKIKDFGSFKLVKVNSRKSVDVNTGEAIEIPSHYKVSFTPDKSLRDRVNAPFAHFESVVLEDGVTFDEKPDEVIEKILEEEKEEILITENPEIGPQEQQEDKPTENSVVAEYISESGMMDNLQREEESQPEDNFQEEIGTESDQPHSEDLYENSGKKKTIIGILVILLVALLAVAWIYKDTIKDIAEDNGFLTQDTTSVDKPVAQQRRVTPMVDSVRTDTIVEDDNNDDLISQSDIDNQQNIPSQATTSVQNTPQSNTQQAGAITTTISPGDTMRKLGLKYYGHKSFWVYIYQENKSKITDPNNVPLGTVLVIPPAEKYNIDANSPESVNKAKNLEGSIFSQF